VRNTDTQPDKIEEMFGKRTNGSDAPQQVIYAKTIHTLYRETKIDRVKFHEIVVVLCRAKARERARARTSNREKDRGHRQLGKETFNWKWWKWKVPIKRKVPICVSQFL
jgi:hypothetical protein